MSKIRCTENVNWSLQLIQLVFIIMKLSSAIDWSWWVVFLPTLVPLGISAILFIVYIAISFINAFSKKRRKINWR